MSVGRVGVISLYEISPAGHKQRYVHNTETTYYSNNDDSDSDNDNDNDNDME